MMRSFRFAAAVAVLTLAGAACANEPNGPGAGGIDHSTGSDQVVLRVSDEGGFVPIEYNLTRFASFTLYGDGRIVVPGAQIELYPGPALPAVSQRVISEAGVQAILQAALDAGLGQGDRDLTDLGSVGIADATTTVFTLTADGRTSTVKVYALFDLQEKPSLMSDEDFQLRRELVGFVQRLTALEQWLPQGSLGAEEPFAAGAYRLFVGPYRSGGDIPQEPADWPLSTPLASFGRPDPNLDTLRCGTVVGDEWAALASSAQLANELTPWRESGERYSILFRPLLPDESGC